MPSGLHAARSCLLAARKFLSHEKNLPTFQTHPQTAAWLPGAHENQGRARHLGTPPATRAQAAAAQGCRNPLRAPHRRLIVGLPATGRRDSSAQHPAEAGQVVAAGGVRHGARAGADMARQVHGHGRLAVGRRSTGPHRCRHVAPLGWGGRAGAGAPAIARDFPSSPPLSACGCVDGLGSTSLGGSSCIQRAGRGMACAGPTGRVFGYFSAH